MDLRVERLGKIRVLPRPEDGLRAVVKCAPRAEALAARVIEKTRPAWTWLYRTWRRLATAGVIALSLWFFVHVMFGANGMVVYRQKRAEYESLRKELNQLQEENERYTQRIKGLKADPATIEKEAREQLHYARPGEVVYVAPPPASPQKPANNAAKK